ncbi:MULTISPECIES: hypothetical protein [unclassified Curtobacterium]|uniref:hypothetical protein n=1 Tax=unclassified Curtobacterium TaxID=257496 RepID=UPI003A80C1D4
MMRLTTPRRRGVRYEARAVPVRRRVSEIQHRGRGAFGLAIAISAALVVTSCSGADPFAEATKDSTMTPQQAHRNVNDVFDTIKGVVGEDGWDDDFESSWDSCPAPSGTSQFSLYAARRLPLSDSPDAVTKRVAAALEASGYDDVRVQHDTTLQPPRTVIGYPNGYNGGTAHDGFGIQFQSGTDYAATIISGHCIPGEPPKLGTPLNPSPTDVP